MFEEFGEHSCRANYLFAQIVAQQGDALSMVSCLDRVVQTSLPSLMETNTNKNWEEQAGFAFFNLAKTLDSKGRAFRESAALSLNCSFQHYNAGGVKLRLGGLSTEDIQSYRENPESQVSLRNLELVE